MYININNMSNKCKLIEPQIKFNLPERYSYILNKATINIITPIIISTPSKEVKVKDIELTVLHRVH